MKSLNAMLIDNTLATLQRSKTKDADNSGKGVKRERNTWMPYISAFSPVSIFFGLQFELIVGLSVFLREEAFSGIKNSLDSIYGNGSVAFWRIMSVSMVSTMISSIVFILLTVKHSKSFGSLALFAGPFFLLCSSMIATKYGSEESDVEFSALTSKIAIAFCMLMGGVHHYFPAVRSLASSSFHAGVVALSNDSRVFKKSLVLTSLNNVWIVSWSIAAFGVYFWATFPDQMCVVSTLGDTSNAPSFNTTFFNNSEGISLLTSLESLESIQEILIPTLCVVFAISIYWTQQMMNQILQTFVAVHIGNWWREKTPGAVADHITFNKSSEKMCQESFTVPILSLLRPFVVAARHIVNNKDEEDDLLMKLHRTTEHANSWAYVSQAIFAGQNDYQSAGEKVQETFSSRGCADVFTDRNVVRMLGVANVSIAMMSGGMALLLDTLFWTPNADLSQGLVFLAAFLGGLVIGNRSLLVFDGAIRTMLICISESFPEGDFFKTRLAFELKQGWRKLHPNVWK